MIEEERKLEEVRQQQWLEEQRKVPCHLATSMQPFARQTLAAQMKPTPKEEKQRKFDMLGELLRKAGVYTDFLKVRIEDARKNTDRHTRYFTCFVNMGARVHCSRPLWRKPRLLWTRVA